MHWAMEPWTSADTGVLETEVGTSGTLANFPEDGSEWSVGVLGRALVFDGVDLWGAAAEPGTAVSLDLFEPYLTAWTAEVDT